MPSFSFWFRPYLRPYISFYQSYCTVFYKFHHLKPSKEIVKNGAQPSNKDILLYSDKGKQIYMFAYDKTTPASQAKRLRDEAESVSWGAIAHWPGEVKSFLSRSDIKVYGDYVKMDHLNLWSSSLFLEELSRAISKNSLPHVLEVLGSFLSNLPAHTIGEERQLTTILRENLQISLKDTSLQVLDGQFLSQSFSEYAAIPDLCICGTRSGAIISGTGLSKITNFDSIAVEGKHSEFAINQCIANMINVGSNLVEKNLRRGATIDTITVYGISASYYEYKGKLLQLFVDFQNNCGRVWYSQDALPLDFCINATCTLLTATNHV